MKTSRFPIVSTAIAAVCLATAGIAGAAGPPASGHQVRVPGVHREAVPQRAPTHLAGAGSATHVRGARDAGGQLAPRRDGVIPSEALGNQIVAPGSGRRSDAGGAIAPRRTVPWSPQGHAVPVRPKSDAGGSIVPKRVVRVSPQDASHEKKVYKHPIRGKADAGGLLEPRRTVPWSPQGHALPVRPKSDAGVLDPKRTGRTLKACEKIRFESRAGVRDLPHGALVPKRDPGTVPAVVGRGGLQVEPLRPHADAGGHLVPRRVRGR